MSVIRQILRCVVLALSLAAGTSARAHDDTPAREMAEAASHWLAALTPEQRDQAVFPLEHAERKNWHFVPRDRQGLPLKAMTPGQQHLAQGLLATALSPKGLLKAHTIISLEEVLRDLERGRGPTRDPQLYYLTLFAQPGPTNTWGWRFEGHHLSLNFLIHDGHDISVTPSMMGANPATVRQGPRQGLRTLAAEEDLARDLVRSFTDPQRQIALLPGNAPHDVLLAPDRPAHFLEPRGLPAASMDAPQLQQFHRLLDEHLQRHRPELAAADLQALRTTDPHQLHFAWIGGFEPGQPHYYRIQGPTFIIEFDQTQDQANHIHTVWRDTRTDFGEDLLRRHYEQSHRPSTSPATAPGTGL